MEINNTVKYKSYNNSLQDIDMGIDVNNTDSIMTLLRNSIYSNPIESFVREIYSNAVDAHLKAGIKTPIKVSIEKYEDSKYYFIVRDFGDSMTVEDFKNVYAKMGSSTKTSSNNEMGGFGLGAKSPLAYTNQFFIDTYTEEDGKKIHRSWVQYIDSSQMGKISLLEENNFMGDTGTQIRIPFEYKDSNKIVDSINKYLSYSIVPFETEGFLFEDTKQFLNVVGERWGLYIGYDRYYSSYNSYAESTIIIGGIPYRLNKITLKSIFSNEDFTPLIEPLVRGKKGLVNNIDSFKCFLEASWYLGYVLIADIGSVDLSASREDLQYTQRTCYFLYKTLFNMYQEYCGHIKIDFTNNPSYLQACKNLINCNHATLKELFLLKLEWEPERLPLVKSPTLFNVAGREAKKYIISETGTYTSNKRKILSGSHITRVHLNTEFKKTLLVLQDTDYKNYSKFLKDYLLRVEGEETQAIVLDPDDLIYLNSWASEYMEHVKLSDIVANYKTYAANNTTSSKRKRDTSVFNSYKYVNREERCRAEGFGKFFTSAKAPSDPDEENYYILNEEIWEIQKEFEDLEFPSLGYYTNFCQYFSDYLEYKGIEKDNVWFMTKASKHFSNDNWISMASIIKEDFKSLDKQEVDLYIKKAFIINYIPKLLPVFLYLKLDNDTYYTKLQNAFEEMKLEYKVLKPEFLPVACLLINDVRVVIQDFESRSFSDRLLRSLKNLEQYYKDTIVVEFKEFLKNYPFLNIVDCYHNFDGLYNKEAFNNYVKAMDVFYNNQDREVVLELPKEKTTEEPNVSEYKLMLNYFS